MPAKPYDAATKQLVESHPGDWIACLGLPPGKTEVIDAELSTVSAEADRVIRVRGGAAAGASDYLAHIEFQSSQDADMPARLARYNLLLWYANRLPVVSVVVLRRRSADSSAITGRLQIERPDSSAPYLQFEYEALRVWEQPPERFLSAGRGTLPLAFLADVERDEVPGIVRAVEERLRQEAAPQGESATLWTTAFILMGLRFDSAFTERILQGVRQMKESVTYQAILQEGREQGLEQGRMDEARHLIVRQGTRRFGAPDAATVAALEAVTSRERLEALADRLLEVESWAELLAAAAA